MKIGRRYRNMRVTLRALRVNSGYTLKQASSKLKISSETLRSYEKARTFPDMRKMSEILSLYNTFSKSGLDVNDVLKLLAVTLGTVVIAFGLMATIVKNMDLKSALNAIAIFYDEQNYSIIDILKPYREIVNKMSTNKDEIREIYWFILNYLSLKKEPKKNEQNYKYFIELKPFMG